jgi:hypothetical protein
MVLESWQHESDKKVTDGFYSGLDRLHVGCPNGAAKEELKED